MLQKITLTENRKYRNRTLFELSGDRTVIFISHRLFMTRMAEQIYMMKQGRSIDFFVIFVMIKETGFK